VLPPLPGGLRLAYATAQPAGTVLRDARNASTPALLLRATPGVAPELCFLGGAALRVLRCGGVCTVEADGALLVRGVAPSRDVAVEVVAPDGATAVAFVVLPAGSRLWVGVVGGARRALLAAPGDAGTLLELDGTAALRARLRVDPATGAAAATLSLLPAPAALRPAGGGGAPPLPPPTPDGAFAAFALAVPRLPPVAASAALRRAGGAPPRPAQRGGAPMAPGNDGTLAPPWETAGVWDVSVAGGGGGAPPPPGVEAVELCLKVNYTGDAARLYATGRDDAPVGDLLGDNFFNNAAGDDAGLWRVGLTRALPSGAPPAPSNYTLRVLGLRADADAWVALDAWPVADFGTGANGSALALHGVSVEVTATAAWVVEG
jgi:hypothetical protein